MKIELDNYLRKTIAATAKLGGYLEYVSTKG